MEAGNLRHRITIQKPGMTRNAYNQPVDTWDTVATVWAAVEPLRGREFYAAQQINAEATVRVRIRYRADVERGMRILVGNKILEILYVIQPELRKRELEILCRERQ